MDFHDIDQLVEDYLIFRNYQESAKKLQCERSTRVMSDEGKEKTMPDNDESSVRETIMTALETSESLRLLTMWDTHVTKGLDNLPSGLIVEARTAEFYLHLFCATYPFRDDIVRTLNTPAEAAKYAARAMTIFKHFIDARGRRLLKTPEFQGFKNLHKIAFPPTHPTYSYMFRAEWQTMAKNRVSGFLEKFLRAKRAPELYTLLVDAEKCKLEAADLAEREKEIRSVFKKREEKLMDFSRSIYSISNDLLNAIDEGGDLNHDFLYKFRLKFDEFHEVLGADAPPPARVHPNKKKRKKGKSRKAPHFAELEYTAMSNDLSSMVAEVGGELRSLRMAGKVLSVIDVEMATGSAMQGCVIFNALREYITRDRVPALSDAASPNKSGAVGAAGTVEAVAQTHIAAAKLFMEHDVFGLRGSALSGGEPAVADGEAAGYLIAFLQVFSASVPVLCSHPYNRDLTKRDDSKQKSISDNMENHFGELLEAASALVYSICRLLAAVSVTLSMQNLLTVNHKEETSAGLHALYDVMVDALLSLPTAKKSLEEHVIVKDLQITLLLALVTLSHDRRHRLTIVKKGLVEWLAATMDAIVQRADVSSETAMNREDKDNFLLCVALANSVVENSEALRAVVSSSRAMIGCQQLFQVMASVLLGNTNVNLDDRQQVLVRVCLRSVNAIVSEKGVLVVLNQEYVGLIALIQEHVVQFATVDEKATPESYDDIRLNEARLISKNILRVTGAANTTDGGGREDVVTLYSDAHKMKSITESTSFMQSIFKEILAGLPDDMNLTEYASEHPKETGLICLINYSKAYREDHGSYETMDGGTDEQTEDDNGDDGEGGGLYSGSEDARKLLKAEIADL